MNGLATLSAAIGPWIGPWIGQGEGCGARVSDRAALTGDYRSGA